MKFFIGDNLRLAGKTRHGKNRIRENGDLWEVPNLDVKIPQYFPLRLAWFQ